MKLFIVRHAEAVEKGTMPDEMRYLTADGRVFFRKTAERLRKQEIEPDIILTSPLVRAVQTAEILAERLNFDGELAVAPDLAGLVTVEGLRRLVGPWPQARRVVVVGHEPFLSALVGEILGLNRTFQFEKGGCVALKYDFEGEPGRFKWYLAGKKKIDEVEEL